MYGGYGGRRLVDFYWEANMASGANLGYCSMHERLGQNWILTGWADAFCDSEFRD
jgi:hypothetical protein